MFNEEKKREEFLKVISDYVEYWDKRVENQTQRERLEGLAFSIMSYIDGCSGDIHALVPLVKTEKGSVLDINNDIAGNLHDYFYAVHRENETKRK